jgi:transposase-like protein
MKRKRYTEEKIISILKEHEASASVPDLSRRYGIAESTTYRWKSKFDGMEASECDSSCWDAEHLCSDLSAPTWETRGSSQSSASPILSCRQCWK